MILAGTDIRLVGLGPPLSPWCVGGGDISLLPDFWDIPNFHDPSAIMESSLPPTSVSSWVFRAFPESRLGSSTYKTQACCFHLCNFRCLL